MPSKRQTLKRVEVHLILLVVFVFVINYLLSNVLYTLALAHLLDIFTGTGNLKVLHCHQVKEKTPPNGVFIMPNLVCQIPVFHAETRLTTTMLYYVFWKWRWQKRAGNHGDDGWTQALRVSE